MERQDAAKENSENFLLKKPTTSGLALDQFSALEYYRDDQVVARNRAVFCGLSKTEISNFLKSVNPFLDREKLKI